MLYIIQTLIYATQQYDFLQIFTIKIIVIKSIRFHEIYVYISFIRVKCKMYFPVCLNIVLFFFFLYLFHQPVDYIIL